MMELSPGRESKGLGQFMINGCLLQIEGYLDMGVIQY